MSNILAQLIKENDAFKKQVNFKRKKYSATDIILRENVPHQEIYFIVKGKVNILISASDQEKVDLKPGLSILEQGDLFGEFCLFDDQPTSASAIAVTDCELIEVEKDSLLKFFHENPKIGYHFVSDVISLTIKRLRKANKAVARMLVWGLRAYKLEEHL